MGKQASPRPTEVAHRVIDLYDDPASCAAAAGLRYVQVDALPGIRRIRRGRGFSFLDVKGRPINEAAVRERISALRIPPAWQDVWICPTDDGHIAAIGVDDRGRRQYLYHEKWRELRDQLNFYRLVVLGERLPRVREFTREQLRRRTLDRDRVLGALIHMADRYGLRIGGEEYAEENDTYGLTTLNRRHARVDGDRIDLRFPAKSGKIMERTVHDRPAARVIGELAEQRHRRLCTVNGARIDASDVNDILGRISGEHLTAKDFRTWRGTLMAFSYLVPRLDADGHSDRTSVTVAALDLAADVLGNTRAVCRAHYVHPDILESFEQGHLAEDLAAAPTIRQPMLDRDERRLLGLLELLLRRRVPA